MVTKFILKLKVETRAMVGGMGRTYGQQDSVMTSCGRESGRSARMPAQVA